MRVRPIERSVSSESKHDRSPANNSLIPQVPLQATRLIPEELTNEYRLLLICARKVLTPQQLYQARSAISGGLDWNVLDRHARDHGLSPLLYSHLERNFPLVVPNMQQQRLKAVETGAHNL